MRAINHALTGAVIGSVVTIPVIALPLAFLSHFVLDAIPHHDDDIPYNTWTFRTQLFIDFLLCVCLVGLLILRQPTGWIIPSVCAFLATSPDLMWIPRFLHAQKDGLDIGAKGWVQAFHEKVQWNVSSQGYVVEIPWFLCMTYIFLKVTA